ncbi:MAG: cytochrome c oxidase subunit II [Bauldia sp.]
MALGLMGMPAIAWANPEPWQIGLQPAATPIMEMIHRFNNGLLIVVSLIALFVLILLVYCIVRFNARMNPVPSKTSHNTVVEVIWTVVPILILVGIAVPSFALLATEHDPARAIPGFNPETDRQLTIKATGEQWSWTYEYPDESDLAFTSNIVRDAAGEPAGEPRLLEVDYPLVVPVGIVVRLLVTADPEGVIHSFAVPAFGIKIDAIPGRLNEAWFRVDREGVYYGQCSELCGLNHAFMPIAVRAVTPVAYDAWAAAAATDLDAAYRQLAAAARPAGTAVAGVSQ